MSCTLTRPRRLMHIVYVSDQIFPSTATDTEQMLNTICALGRAGARVELLSPRPRGAEVLTPETLADFYQVEPNFTVSQYTTPFRQIRWAQKVVHALRSSITRRPVEPDVVYTRNLPFLFAGTAMGLTLAYEHFRPWPTQYPALKLPIARAMKSDAFVGGLFHSDFARQSYLQLGIPEERLMVVHNGYEPSRMEPRLNRVAARERIGLDPKRRVVTYTGHINARKGLETVLEIARRRPDVTFALVGSEGDGPIEREAASIANVRVVPWQKFDATAKWLYAADILIIPPNDAPLQRHGNTVLPMKLFQYLAAGRPILGPRTPDTAELLVNGQNAELVTPGSIEDAIAALDRILGDDEHWETLAAGATQTGAELTWDARAQKILSFLEGRLSRMTPVERHADRPAVP